MLMCDYMQFNYTEGFHTFHYNFAKLQMPLNVWQLFNFTKIVLLVNLRSFSISAPSFGDIYQNNSRQFHFQGCINVESKISELLQKFTEN